MQKSDPGYYVRRPPSPRVPNPLEIIQDPVIQEMFREEAMKSLLPVFVTPEIQVFSISDLLYPNSWIKRLFLEGTTSMTPPSLEDTEEFGEQHAAKLEASGGCGGQVVGSVTTFGRTGVTPAPDVEYVATVVHSGRRAGVRPSKTHNLSFSTALVWLKAGHLLRRVGWNGKGMFIFLISGSTFEVNRPPLLGIFQAGKIIDYHAHIDMKTADNMVVPWLCSQTDMLAEDWEFADIPAVDVAHAHINYGGGPGDPEEPAKDDGPTAA